MKEWSKKQWILAYVFVAVTGTVFHFGYDWLQQNKIAGYFFPVNESTWEHMKLVYLPMLLCTWLFVKKMPPQWMLGNLAGTWVIPVLFYTYRGILGFGVSAIDIATFYLAVFVAFWIIYHTLDAKWSYTVCSILRILVIVQGIAFVIFTYNPLGLGIFAEP